MTQPVDRQTPGVFMRTMQRIMPKITPAHVGMYRLFRGRVVDKGSGGAPVLLLTTTGRRSGQSRTVVLGHINDGEHEIVAGTNGGLEALPSWILNLQSDASCTVELGSDQFDAEAEFLKGDQWEQQWSRFVEAFPTYDQAHRWAGRPVPLVRLRRL
jgi:proline iminopeptidase